MTSAVPSSRYNILGVGISPLTLDSATNLVLTAHGRTRLGYICLCTVHGISEARADPAFRAILNRSWLTTADGMPLVWLGPAGTSRVYGPDLLVAVCDAGRATGLTHYFYGAGPGVAQELAARMTARFPGLKVAGTFTPPFRPLGLAERQAFIADVARARPDVLWVGLGTPKQERFMAEFWDKLDAGVLIGIGAAFDFHSGRIAQAPLFMQRTGLEWLFRLATEPRRLASRYLINNPLFVFRILAQKTGLKSYPLDTNEPLTVKR